MKESRLFLDFLKRNNLTIFLPVLIGILISIYFYSSEAVQTKLSQAFRSEYGFEDMEKAISLTDEAVAELRISDFDNFFPGTKAIIYKPAPLIINIDVVSEDKEKGFELLLKETEYLKKNFSVSTLTQVQLTSIEPDLFKYILTGIILGTLIGFTSSLIREYFRNY